MRKVYVNVITRLIINLEEGIENEGPEIISNIIDNLDYDFTSFTDGAYICDSEIIDFEIMDSE